MQRGGLVSAWITTLAMQGQRRGGGRGGGRQHSNRGGRWKGRGNGHHRPNHRRNYLTDTTAALDSTTQIEEMGIPIPGETIAIAVEGCCHGKLDDIYARLSNHQDIVDLLICCGDFQSLRSTADFHSFAVPPKYHDLGCFHPYYTGAKVAPILTIFVGGNHEASQPLQELYYGGWVAPNIYYLGAAGVVQYRGIRIGGLSGIYKSYDYTQSRYEMPPYDRSTMRSVYHYRNVETYRLQCLSSSPQRLEVMISHDWPQGIEQYGDTQGLLRRKPFFQQEVEQNELGSPPAMQVLKTIRPLYWFAAHLHVKFTAQVKHGKNEEKSTNTDPTVLVPTQAMRPKSTSLDPSTQFLAPGSSPALCKTTPDLTDLMTQFLSLDKCLPRRHYLSIVHIPTKASTENTSSTLQYDPEWLAILKHTHELSRSDRKERVRVPNTLHHVTESELADIRNRFENNFAIPTNDLEPTVPVETQGLRPPLPRMGHPQTDAFLKRLGLDHIPNLTIPYLPLIEMTGMADNQIDVEIKDGNEIALESDVEDVPAETTPASRECKKPKMEESSLS